MEDEKKIVEVEKDYFTKFKDSKVLAHKKSAYVLDWNCNGKYLASADNSIKIWRYKNQSLVKEKEFKAHSENVESMQWHPTEKYILCSCSKDSVKLWKIKESKAQFNYQSKAENSYLTWSPDGTKIAVGNKNNVITLIDSKTFKPIQELRIQDDDLSEFAWDPKGSVLFVTACSRNIGYIHLYDGQNPTEKLHTLECHRAMINTIATDQQGKYFATGGNDSLAAIWDQYEMICVNTHSNLEGIVRKLSFSHNSKYLATASQDSYVDIFNVEKGFLSFRIKCQNGQNCVKWHPTELTLAYIGESRDGKDNKQTYINVFYQNPTSQN